MPHRRGAPVEHWIWQLPLTHGLILYRGTKTTRRPLGDIKDVASSCASTGLSQDSGKPSSRRLEAIRARVFGKQTKSVGEAMKKRWMVAGALFAGAAFAYVKRDVIEAWAIERLARLDCAMNDLAQSSDPRDFRDFRDSRNVPSAQTGQTGQGTCGGDDKASGRQGSATSEERLALFEAAKAASLKTPAAKA